MDKLINAGLAAMGFLFLLFSLKVLIVLAPLLSLILVFALLFVLGAAFYSLLG